MAAFIFSGLFFFIGLMPTFFFFVLFMGLLKAPFFFFFGAPMAVRGRWREQVQVPATPNENMTTPPTQNPKETLPYNAH